MSDAGPDPRPAASEAPTSNAAVLDFSGVHGMIRGFLAKIGEAQVNTPGDAKRGRTLADLVLFGVAGLRFHHHVEDHEYWPALIAKGADGHLLEPLERDHRELDSLLDDLEARAGRLRSAPTDAGALASVAELLPGFGAHVGGHLDKEEPVMFPMLEQYISNEEAHAMATRAARTAPKKGISWLMGGIVYSMTPAEADNFLSVFPKPIVWLQPLLLRRYRRNCRTLGIAPELSA